MSGRGLVILFGSLAVFAVLQMYAMFFLFAFMTGWQRLARAYPLDPARKLPELGPTRGVAFATWGWNAPPMQLGYDADVFVLRPLLLFRPAFRTLAVPWSVVTGVERNATFEGEIMVMRFGTSGHEKLAFLPSLLDERLAGLAEGGNIRGSSERPGEIIP